MKSLRIIFGVLLVSSFSTGTAQALSCWRDLGYYGGYNQCEVKTGNMPDCRGYDGEGTVCSYKKREENQKVVTQYEPVQGEENTVNTVYYGLLEETNKSGSGRTTAAKARLDVCFNQGYITVNSLYSLSDCFTACDNTTVNMACREGSNAGTCYTRCDAVW